MFNICFEYLMLCVICIIGFSLFYFLPSRCSIGIYANLPMTEHKRTTIMLKYPFTINFIHLKLKYKDFKTLKMLITLLYFIWKWGEGAYD